MTSLRRAVFLDRDGTLNVDHDYVHRPDQWEWIAGARDAVGALRRAGFLAVVITNQSGVARGFYSESDVERLHSFVNEDLARHGTRIDAFYFCPHLYGAEKSLVCDCRKPAPGLLLRAAKDHGIDLARSYMVGDKRIDVLAARAAGVTPILVETGYGAEEKRHIPPEVAVATDLAAAWDWIKAR